MTQEVIESLVAQLETSKQMFNESLNNVYQVRLNNHILNTQIAKLNKQIENLTKELADEKAKHPEVNPSVPVEEVPQQGVSDTCL